MNFWQCCGSNPRPFLPTRTQNCGVCAINWVIPVSLDSLTFCKNHEYLQLKVFISSDEPEKNHTSAFANRKVKGKVLICWEVCIVIKCTIYSLCTITNKQHVSPEYCCRGSLFLFSILKVASWCRLAHLVYFLASFDKLALFSCCSPLGLPVGPEHKARALSPSRTG